MFKNKKTMKTLVFSLGLAAMLVTSIDLNAQNESSRGLFGLGKSSADYDYSGNRDGGVTIGGMQNDNPAPLGGGLLIMLGAGVGYVALKKNKED